ncbi:hypothetical protein [Intrasporangium sp.]|uniref:hypothetical protein n=1 Tax=Intrasporangium sp. TaxID=1925024 RepID=UPI003221E92E
MFGRHSPRSFDAVALGRLETDAWVGYYRRDWVRTLRSIVGMVDEGFGLGPWATWVAAWHVLRANQAWAPVPDNDPEAARAAMRRFYRLLHARSDLDFEPDRAATLEVEWWRIHRARQRDDAADRADLERALVDLYAHVYGVPRGSLHEAARWRVEAMDLSDAWVAGGCDPTDPRLAAERRALVASYAALLDTLCRVGA